MAPSANVKATLAPGHFAGLDSTPMMSDFLSHAQPFTATILAPMRTPARYAGPGAAVECDSP